MPRFRYRTPIVLGPWQPTRWAVANDATRTGFAGRSRGKPDGLEWHFPGEIEEERCGETPLTSKH